MNFLQKLRYKTLSKNPQVQILVKEIFRKTIHLCAALVPIFAALNRRVSIIFLTMITVFYSIFEILRLKGKNVFLISSITNFAARKRDNGRFVLGPVTLSAGIILSLILFPFKPACIGILALALGDGLSGLIGKIFGIRHLFNLKDKTIAGSAACFTAIFISTLLFALSPLKSFVIALLGTGVEILPLKDFDNLLIPLVCGSCAYFLGV